MRSAISIVFVLLTAAELLAANKPNILWVVTDDQRADSIAAFNQIRTGKKNSALGQVLSPNIDRLAKMGTTFINAFNQNPGCAPSRTLMHTGRYSHRTGVYGFEYYNATGQAHWRPMVPEILRDQAGYQTLAVGKLGIRAQHFSDKGGPSPPLYETNLGYRKEFAAKGLVDWNSERKWANGQPGPKNETFYFPDGEQLRWPEIAGTSPDDRDEIRERLDLLRQYAPGDQDPGGSILGGVNSQSGDRTRDGSFTAALLDHLDHADKPYTDLLGRKQDGPRSDKPLFAYIGFEFPHTPVLPPAEFRSKFQKLEYQIPTFSEEELAAFPPQLKKLFSNSQSDHFSDAEKHQMIADYYAFCAYGDSLVGQAVDGFIEYSEKQNRPWLILYVCGDHGWRLNEHGMVSKFSHYDTDLHNPIIVVSSDKDAFPAGKSVEDFACFVDMAPTFLGAAGIDTSTSEYQYLDGRDLAATAAGTLRPRDYIIAEPTWVIGPRAVIRTKDYKFAMKTRPRSGHTMTKATAGQDIRWAITADLKEIEPTLFDLRDDPAEQHNLAFDPRYRPVLDVLRDKLQDIVLGDGRTEIAWTKAGNDPAHYSDFAIGADDGSLQVPAPLAAAATTTSEDPSTASGRSESPARSGKKPNIVVVFADDISARELPLYGSSVWSSPTRGNTTDPEFRASTPVLDGIAREGCWIETAWASVVCSPSRAMMMTGRYAHLHKWWGNKSKGKYLDDSGKEVTWPLYLSSPIQIGHLAQQAGYRTYWAGKTQMAGDLRRFGFDQGCFTPGSLSDKDNPFTDFKLAIKKVGAEKVLVNVDTDQPVDTYQQHGWYWFPHVRLMNHDDKDFQWWPNTPESQSSFGVNTYGPDVELDFVFDFMERQVAADKPFFVYHTSHLGHDAFNWLDPDSNSKWPGTPVIQWDGEQYTRVDPNITGDAGEYETHGTVSAPGIHHHVNYLDYQAWLYQSKLKELGIADNTVFIFCSDNGTSGYGKNSPDRQKGTHVPMIISAPGMTKKGKQDVLVNMSDILPTIAELTGAELPDDYEINGESLVPFLFTDKADHRDWLYGYLDSKQIIRGTRVMRDGRGKWWDVSTNPTDLISFPEINDWSTVSASHRSERDKLLAILPRFDQQTHGKNAPQATTNGSAEPRESKTWTLTFEDDYDNRSKLGKNYTTARGHADGWTVHDGVLVGKQTNADHGAVIRTKLDFRRRRHSVRLSIQWRKEL